MNNIHIIYKKYSLRTVLHQPIFAAGV